MPAVAQMSAESKTPELIEKQVDQFIERQRQQQVKLEAEKRRNNYSIGEMVKRSKTLSPEIVDKIFNPFIEKKIPTKSVDNVRKTLHTMRLKVNALDPKKRFLILETMDFFRSKIGIGKLIPAILMLQGNDRKKAFLQFVIPTFNSINKNIETLVSTPELFTKETLHLNRGSLYSFVSDLAKLIIPVFQKNYLNRFSDIVSPVELLLMALKPFNNRISKQNETVFRFLIDDEDRIRQILLDFIVAIQSHEALFNYAIKRHGYYKLFLYGLTAEKRFQDCESYIVSKILAGCFMGNEQLKPSTTLIDAMIDPGSFSKPATVKAKKRFIDKLAPTTVIKIINQFKIHLQLLLKSTFSKEFSDVQDLSAKSILKKVWTGFTRLADEGLSRLSAPLELIVNQIKKTFTSFIESEEKEKEKAKKALNKPIVTLIPKKPESIASFKRNYALVDPSLSGFRGVREGATQKDHAYNSRFFQKGEITLLEFTYCFKRLFEFLSRSKNKKVKIISHDKEKGIFEYHSTFLTDRYLIALGLTRLKTESKAAVQKKELFPYVLLFTESSREKTGRIPGRELVIKGKKRIFNETVLLKENAKVFYKSVLYILHLLPNEDWNSSAAQACIKFIVKELKKASE
jgi:hypothetical protein